MLCQKHFRSFHLFPILLVLIVPLLCYSKSQPGETSTLQQRSQYKEALKHLSQGQIKKFSKLQDELDSYLLKDYLSYHKFNRLLHKRSQVEMDEFKTKFAHLPVTAILEKRWLKLIGKQRRWKAFQDNYVTTSDPELRCLYARSLYGTNQKDEALALTGDLWVKPKSQPKVCDPLFEVWKKTKYFDEEVVWSRLKLTIGANERQLSRYLLRFLSGSNKQAGQILYRVHTQPKRISTFKSLGASKEKEKHIVLHGVSRLSKNHPTQAKKAWSSFKGQYSFSDQEIQLAESNIVKGQAKENIFPGTSDRYRFKDETLLKELANSAIKNANWEEASYWVKRVLSIEEDIRWDYWLSRAQIEIGGEEQEAKLRLTRISNERHYYGFMAASLLQSKPRINDASLSRSALQVPNNQNVFRAKELFAVGDNVNARREWYRTLSTQPDEEKINSIYFINDLGKTPLTIRTAGDAGARDHLKLRFPILYQQEFKEAALTTDQPLALLYAVSRQESAFNVLAVSSANARGLMQLIPSTANLTARRMGLSAPSTSRLHNPGLNIKLGSFHLSWLLKRYRGQTALAVAAYNAGEQRVDRWTKGKKALPLDVWIEQIPFKETRNYVKNVLAFRQVYAQLINQPLPFISPPNKFLR